MTVDTRTATLSLKSSLGQLQEFGRADEKEEILRPKRNDPAPRPVFERECACGCGHNFFPSRKDKIYLNKQHADYAYNNDKRKMNNSNQLIVNSQLLKNDNLLKKYYDSDTRGKEVILYKDILKADGFNFAYQIGKSENSGIDYYHTYNYFYTIFNERGVDKIKIYKR